MKSKVIALVIAVLGVCLLPSCKDESEKRIEYAKIAESRTSQDLLNDLYVGSDADVEAIARIMNVTPSSIERIRKGETDPTDQFEERINEVTVYYMQNGQKFSRLRSLLDPEYGWYDKVLDFPTNHPWWFWGINIGLFLLLCWNLIIILGFFYLFELVVFGIAWIASLVCSPDAINDKYTDTINPVIEQIK